MAIEIKIPKEINEYKEKVVMGLTLKQVVSLAGALAVGVPLYIFGSKIIPEDMVSWAIIVLCAPILAIGFVRYHNMNFIQLAKRFAAMQFQPQKRKYKELPVFWYAREQQNKEMLLREKEIKRLQKNKAKKKILKCTILSNERRSDVN